MGKMSGVVSSVVCIAVILVAGVARAQDAELQLQQLPLRFDFLNPGARSMSLGSAFVGLADDATAAFTNPAGLDRLSRPEISFEFRGRRSDNEFLRGGRLSGTPTMRGLDTSPIPDYGTSLDSTGGAGFLSLVYPRKRWAVAAFRHELVRGSQHFDSQGSFFTDAVTSGNVRLLPIQAYQDVGITNYGASVGFKVNNAVSIGGGVSAATLKLEQTVYSYRVPSTDFYAASDYSASQRVIAATQKSDNYTGVGFTVGTLLRVTPKVQIGAVYRGAPTFNFDAKTDLLQPSSTVRSDIGVLLQAPNVFSTGASVRANDSVLLTFEYDFVAHSM